MNRTTVSDQEFNVLPGAMETLSHENGDQIAKVARLSRKVSPETYGSMVVYLTKNNDAKRLQWDAKTSEHQAYLHTCEYFLHPTVLQEHYFLVAGESTYTSVFEQITGPEQCYNCQGFDHKAFSCSKNRVCARCAAESHHHSECQAQIPKCAL
ncbi:hypothetical protein HZ326_27591 [Fusarium oxysporum f. sp. albedinis]|nr:hypothetical protein HZ326_27591 [Fusarium oxysporum f. sp. albedinis]